MLRLRTSGESFQEVEFALALGSYLRTLEWHHFVTVTTERPATSTWLCREYHNRFVRRLAFAAKRPLAHFFAIEHDGVTGQFAHLHALIEGTTSLSVDAIKRLWPYGFTHVAPYDQRRHAAHYVVKDLLIGDPDDYGWSRQRPPQRTPWGGTVEREFRDDVKALRARCQ